MNVSAASTSMVPALESVNRDVTVDRPSRLSPLSRPEPSSDDANILSKKEKQFIDLMVRLLEHWNEMSPQHREMIRSMCEEKHTLWSERRAAVREAWPDLTEEQRQTLREVAEQIHDRDLRLYQEIRSRLGLDMYA